MDLPHWQPFSPPSRLRAARESRPSAAGTRRSVPQERSEAISFIIDRIERFKPADWERSAGLVGVQDKAKKETHVGCKNNFRKSATRANLGHMIAALQARCIETYGEHCRRSFMLARNRLAACANAGNSSVDCGRVIPLPPAPPLPPPPLLLLLLEARAVSVA